MIVGILIKVKVDCVSCFGKQPFAHFPHSPRRIHRTAVELRGTGSALEINPMEIREAVPLPWENYKSTIDLSANKCQGTAL